MKFYSAKRRARLIAPQRRIRQCFLGFFVLRKCGRNRQAALYAGQRDVQLISFTFMRFFLAHWFGSHFSHAGDFKRMSVLRLRVQAARASPHFGYEPAVPVA